MCKKKLTEEELEQLRQQYYDLTSDLKQYSRLFWQRRFWKAPRKTREETFSQYKFIKGALNATLDTLCAENGMTIRLAEKALYNRFVKIRTKINIMKSI